MSFAPQLSSDGGWALRKFSPRRVWWGLWRERVVSSVSTWCHIVVWGSQSLSCPSKGWQDLCPFASKQHGGGGGGVLLFSFALILKILIGFEPIRMTQQIKADSEQYPKQSKNSQQTKNYTHLKGNGQTALDPLPWSTAASLSTLLGPRLTCTGCKQSLLCPDPLLLNALSL